MKEHFNDDTDNAVNGGHQKITIRAGAASAGSAPLKFTTGTLLSTPETGAMEFAGDNYYLTQTTSTIRKKIAIYDDTSGATGDIYYRNSGGYFTRLAAGSAGDLLTIASGIPSWTSSIVGKVIDNTSTVTLKDTNFTLQDDGDTTKQMKFQLSGIAAGATRTLTVPDADTTIAGTDTTQTLTNKRINPRILNISSTATPAINTDLYDIVYVNALAVNITGFTMSGTPVDGQMLRIAITTTGAARNVTFGTSFEATSYQGVPTAVAANIRQDFEFVWNTATSKWRLNDILNYSNIATVSNTQTLSNKTLTAPRIANAGFIADANGNEQIVFNTTTSAVNEIAVTNAATGSAPRIAAQGGDTNVNLDLYSKGTGTVRANGVQVATTADIASKADVDVLGTTDVLKGTSLNLNPESANFTFMPGYFNDLAFNNLRGGTTTVTKNGSPFTFTNGDNWFKPGSSFVSVSSGLATSDVFVITVTTTETITWNGFYGITFPHSWNARDVTIEVYFSGAWTQIYSVTNSTDYLHLVRYTANSGAAITQLRYTLTNLLTTSGLRISSLFAVDFDSTGMASGFVTREGGALYGTNATPPTLYAAGGDTNIDLNLIPKGTGRVEANGIVIPTVSSSDTLTNKTLTTPTLTTPVINGTPTGTGISTAPTASTLILRDTNGNVSVSALIQGFTSTPTAAGITTLTVVSDGIQEFTGTSTQTVRLPTTSIPAGICFTIINSSTGAVTVQSSGANTISILPGGTSATFTSLVATPTTAANWESTYINTGDVSSNTSTSVDNELVLFNGTTGKSVKRATGTGVATLTSGVLSTVSALPMSRIGIGDFENIASGSDFETEFYPWNLGTGRTIANDQAHSGTYSYKFTAGAGGASFTGGTVELKEGEKLYVECWVRRDVDYNATDARIRLGAMPGNLNVANLFFRASDVPEIDTWVKKSFTTNAYPAGNIGVSISITMTGLTAGNLWIDDILIRRVKAVELIPDLDTGKLTTGTLPVARGGTGVSTLTGLVKGNGTSAFTAAVAGTDYVTPAGTETLGNKTLTTPTIASFANAAHNHTNAAGGGQLTATTALNATGTASSTTYLRGDNTWAAITTGDASTNTSTSVDGEVVLFNGTTGKSLRRATGSGIATLSAGVLSTTATTGSGNVVLATSPTITTPVINGTPSGTGTSVSPTANTLALRDANSNLSASLLLLGFTSTVTSTTAVTLTLVSNQLQIFTGTSNQTVVLPTTSVVAGTQFRVINNSTGVITVNASGGTTVVTLAANTSALVTSLQATPTTNAHWDYQYWASNVATGKTLTVSQSLTLSGTDGTTMTFPNASGTVMTIAATQTVTNKDLTSGTNTFPTFNQNTTGSAGTLTTARTIQTNLASTSSASFNGSANVTPGVTGTLPVGNGGTGATTLTGLVKGNGTSAFTAAVAGTDYVTPAGTETLTNKNLTGTGNTYSASNLTTGTLPDARMTGTYSGFTHKIDGANTLFTTPSSGTTSALGRTVYGLAEYRGNSASITGAIVFYAPAAGMGIMMQLEVSGLLYNQNVVDMVVQGYRSTTTAWADTRKISRGSVDIDARWAMDPSGNNCLILGDVGTVWNYPHFTITRAMFSHTSTTDAFCAGWTVGLVTDLSTYTNVSAIISNLATVGNISGSAATLTTARNIQTNLASTSAASFNGSASVTPGVTGTLPVTNGGTGRATSTTAYGIIAAGTTATGVQQTIAPGTSGQFLKSAGASTLASFASITATDISDSTATGRSVLTATDAAAARTAIGAGTGNGDVTLTGTQTLTNKTITGGRYNVLNDVNGAPILGFIETSGAVNYMTVRNRGTGSEPFFEATGSDTDISFGFVPKGNGDLRVYKNTGGVRIYANGGDTNVDLNLATKGTGLVRANNIEVATISGSQTLTNKTISGTTNTITVADANFTIQDDVDATKIVKFSVGNLSTATTVTLNAPNVGAGSHTLLSRNSGDTVTNKRIQPRVLAITSSATPSVDTDEYDFVKITALAANITSMTTNLTGAPEEGEKIMFRIKDNGTARTISWGASFQSSGVANLLTTTAASKTHHILFVWDVTISKWVCIAVDTMGY